MHTRMHAYIHTHIHAYTHTHIHTYIHTLHACTHAYTYTYTYTDIHIHNQYWCRCKCKCTTIIPLQMQKQLHMHARCSSIMTHSFMTYLLLYFIARAIVWPVWPVNSRRVRQLKARRHSTHDHAATRTDANWHDHAATRGSESAAPASTAWWNHLGNW